MSQADWPGHLARVIAAEVRRHRTARGLSAQQLADRCAELGADIPRAVLANLENGRRSTVTVAELLVLAQALQVSPLLLVVPLGRAEIMEILPGMDADTFEAARWWRGEGSHMVELGEGPVLMQSTVPTAADLVLDHQGQLVSLEIADHAARDAAVMASQAPEGERAGWLDALTQRRERVAQIEGQISKMRIRMRREGLIPPPLPPQLGRLDLQPVVAAVVTSPEGVLIGRRNDGRPPWTFIAGEMEPNERPEDTAIREVKEETGVEIRVGEIIGERDHPATGRYMIYMSATPARATRLIVGDYAELAEVRWANLAEADQLLPGMFGPVREYLARTLEG